MNSSQRSKIIRIGLVIAIVAGFGVGGLNGWKVREKILRLQSSLAEQTSGRQKAATELVVKKQELEATSAALAQTKVTLQATTQERDLALATTAEQQKRADRLAKDLAASRAEAEKAQTELARYRAAEMEPEQIIRVAEVIRKLRKDLETAEGKHKILNAKVADLTVRLRGESFTVELPAELDTKVLAFDPKWQFVVLDAGENQGVLEDGELLVNRDGKLVAKVVVSRVEKDRCVATIMPGWKLGEIAEGDRAIAAHPKS
jgi:cell shape-determining protein MreC